MRDNGWIQCGYHGWSYDGETGKLREIPNMKGEQRFPPLYKAVSFAVVESAGFVHAALAQPAAPPPPGPVLKRHGTAYVGLPHDEYIAAFFDDLGLLIRIRGVHFTPYLAAELTNEAGWLVMERNCQWRAGHWPAPFSSEFPLTLLSKTHPITGETILLLRDDSLRPLLHARFAPVPAARGVTAICWRAGLSEPLAGLQAQRLRAGAAFHVNETIDAAVLRRLTPSASLHGADLRAAMTRPLPATAA